MVRRAGCPFILLFLLTSGNNVLFLLSSGVVAALEVGRLQKQLDLAIREGNTDRMEKLQRQLSLYSLNVDVPKAEVVGSRDSMNEVASV